MKTIVIRTAGDIIDPLPDTPILPDLDTGLHLHFRASDYSFSNNADVTSLLMEGAAPEGDRLFSSKFTSGWQWPRWSTADGPNGGESLEFNGSARIANVASAGSSVSETLSDPVSMVLVFRQDEHGTSRRIVSGGIEDRKDIYPGASSASLMNINSGEAVWADIGTIAEEWCFVAAVFNGANSKLIGQNGTIYTLDPGTGPWVSCVLGGSLASSDPAGASFVGGVAEFRLYSRALSDVDLIGLRQAAFSEYGIG